MTLIRFTLIIILIFLIIRAFSSPETKDELNIKEPEPDKKKSKPYDGVPKGIGEYIDYEEVDKE
jgi:large-conductance mechanosensitive channel